MSFFYKDLSQGIRGINWQNKYHLSYAKIRRPEGIQSDGQRKSTELFTEMFTVIYSNFNFPFPQYLKT